MGTEKSILGTDLFVVVCGPAHFPNLNLSDTGNKTAKRLHIKPQHN
jgi:hypothetical protein